MDISRRMFAVLAVLGSQWILASYAQESITPSPTSSSVPIQTHIISVGIDHKFKPEVTQAEIGDVIDFQFFPPNHSVVRAEYEMPCIPYEMSGGRGKVGFFSGFHPVDAILDEPPSWTIKINDTDPIFFYCSAPGSCIGYGMVGVINPSANTSLENQRRLAKDSAYMLNPGEPFPAEGGPSPSASSTSALSTTSTSATAPAAATSSEAPTSNGSSGLSKGAIAGIAVGGAAFIVLAAALFFYIGRTRSLKQAMERTDAKVPVPPQSPPMYPHYSFASPKSEMGESFRNSHGAVPPYASEQQYGNIGAMTSPDTAGYGGHPTNDYQDAGAGYPRAGTISPTSEVEYGSPRHGGSRTNSTVPQRYPSLALNPNHPTEIGS